MKCSRRPCVHIKRVSSCKKIYPFIVKTKRLFIKWCLRPFSRIRIRGIAVRFIFEVNLRRHFYKFSLTHDNLRAILYSSNSKNLLRNFLYYCMYSYFGIGSIERTLTVLQNGDPFSSTSTVMIMIHVRKHTN